MIDNSMTLMSKPKTYPIEKLQEYPAGGNDGKETEHLDHDRDRDQGHENKFQQGCLLINWYTATPYCEFVCLKMDCIYYTP
jgi:hypothetical protein